MADIIEQIHLHHPATGEYIAGVTLEVNTETNEGYCVNLYDVDSFHSTSFGKEESAACLAKETYEAVCNCMMSIFETFNNETDFWSEHDFWVVFNSHFQPGWFYYNVSSDSIETRKGDANKLFTFIAKWKTKAEPVGYAKTVVGQSSSSSTLDFEDQNIRLHASSECGAFQETMTELMTTERGQDAILETFMKSLDEAEVQRDEEKEDAEAEEFFSQLSDPDFARQYYQMMKRQGF